MTLGLGLFYVGCVLFMNGIATYTKIEPRASAIMNFFTGGLLVVINSINIANVVFGNPTSGADFYGIATNMLFGFTYCFVGMTNWFGLEGRPLGWYCFFVACNTVPAFMICFVVDNNPVWGIIWILWGLLWLAFWINGVLGKFTYKFMGLFTSIIGVITCWLPGLLLICGWWPFG